MLCSSRYQYKKVGDVLNLQILPIAPVLVKFPLNVYSMDVTLEENNTWTVAPSKDYSGVRLNWSPLILVNISNCMHIHVHS